MDTGQDKVNGKMTADQRQEELRRAFDTSGVGDSTPPSSGKARTSSPDTSALDAGWDEDEGEFLDDNDASVQLLEEDNGPKTPRVPQTAPAAASMEKTAFEKSVDAAGARIYQTAAHTLRDDYINGPASAPGKELPTNPYPVATQEAVRNYQAAFHAAEPAHNAPAREKPGAIDFSSIPAPLGLLPLETTQEKKYTKADIPKQRFLHSLREDIGQSLSTLMGPKTGAPMRKPLQELRDDFRESFAALTKPATTGTPMQKSVISRAAGSTIAAVAGIAGFALSAIKGLATPKLTAYEQDTAGKIFMQKQKPSAPATRPRNEARPAPAQNTQQDFFARMAAADQVPGAIAKAEKEIKKASVTSWLIRRAAPVLVGFALVGGLAGKLMNMGGDRMGTTDTTPQKDGMAQFDNVPPVPQDLGTHGVEGIKGDPSVIAAARLRILNAQLDNAAKTATDLQSMPEGKGFKVDGKDSLTKQFGPKSPLDLEPLTVAKGPSPKVSAEHTKTVAGYKYSHGTTNLDGSAYSASKVQQQAKNNSPNKTNGPGQG